MKGQSSVPTGELDGRPDAPTDEGAAAAPVQRTGPAPPAPTHRGRGLPTPQGGARCKRNRIKRPSANTRAARLAANRRNALRSTGPRTPQGKAVSCMNALRHGLLARLPVLPDLEAQEDWEGHLERVFEALRPLGYLEEALAERIALLLWRLARVVRYEREVMAVQIELARERTAESKEGHMLGRLPVSVKDLRAVLSLVRRLPRLKDGDAVHPDMVVYLVEMAEEVAGACLDEVEEEKVYTEKSWTASDLRAVLDALAQASETPRQVLLELVADQVQSTLLGSEREEAEAQTEEDLTRRSSLLPADGHADKIVRYEAHLERGFYKALHELQRIQAGRAGAYVPPPAALDVTVGGGFVPQNEAHRATG